LEETSKKSLLETDGEPPVYVSYIFANRYPLDGMGRKPDLDTYDERAFLVNLNHSKLFAIPRHDHIETHKDLVVEECALEMLLASARANAYKCTNILGVKPGLISHQIVGRNGMWPSLEDQIHHSKKEYDLFSCYTFLKICRTSIEAAITILSEALVKYEEDPEILWSLLNHQSVSYSTNGKEALDFLVDYADVPLAKRAVEEYEERSSEMFDEVAVMEAQNNARVNFHKRVATATGTEPVCCTTFRPLLTPICY